MQTRIKHEAFGDKLTDLEEAVVRIDEAIRGLEHISKCLPNPDGRKFRPAGKATIRELRADLLLINHLLESARKHIGVDKPHHAKTVREAMGNAVRDVLDVKNL